MKKTCFSLINSINHEGLCSHLSNSQRGFSVDLQLIDHVSLRALFKRRLDGLCFRSEAYNESWKTSVVQYSRDSWPLFFLPWFSGAFSIEDNVYCRCWILMQFSQVPSHFHSLPLTQNLCQYSLTYEAFNDVSSYNAFICALLVLSVQ